MTNLIKNISSVLIFFEEKSENPLTKTNAHFLFILNITIKRIIFRRVIFQQYFLICFNRFNIQFKQNLRSLSKQSNLFLNKS